MLRELATERSCDYCGAVGEDWNYIYMYNGDELCLCDCCREDIYFCDNCYDGVDSSDIEEFNGNYYCPNCYERVLEEEIIKPYEYKGEDEGTLEFLGCPDNDRYFGVELEIGRGREHKSEMYKTAKHLTDNYAVICKRDCSIPGSGFEIVSQPCSLEIHQEESFWGILCSTVLHKGYKSNDTKRGSDSCGLHVHVSIDGIEDYYSTMYKVLLFGEKNFDKLLKLSRRESLEWCHKYNIENMDKVVDKFDYLKHIVRGYEDRYHWLNFCNYNTVEFRLFNGSLRQKDVVAAIEFCDAIIDYASSSQFSFKWSNFVNYIESEQGKYNYLNRQYITDALEGKFEGMLETA